MACVVWATMCGDRVTGLGSVNCCGGTMVRRDLMMVGVHQMVHQGVHQEVHQEGRPEV